ncbi:MAG: nitroreductase family protein [Clostridia bacterium]|nr:nitroreductase family protein [Clostridia bacterium]
MLLDLVKRARSYRRYDPTKPLSKDDLKAFVEAARLTPSAGNLQRLRYLAVTEKSEVLALTKEIKWAGYLSDWDGPADSEAPSAYLILLSPESTGVSQIDVGIAAETILLAAAEAGVGGCMILNFPREALTERYKLASNYKIELVISLGVPAEKVEIETMKEGNVRYYRDENDVHHVPKRALSEVFLTPEDI